MENEKKLEKTLCGMLPYGLQCILTEDKTDDFLQEDYYEEKKIKEGAIWELIGFNYAKDLNIYIGEGVLDGALFRNGNTYVNFQRGIKPLLHSLDKLTQPILEGGLIPIDELKRLFYPNEQFSNGGYLLEELIFENNSFKIKIYDNCYTGDYSKEYTKNIEYDLTLKIVEQLKKWHFNIFDLFKEIYVEKSTLIT